MKKIIFILFLTVFTTFNIYTQNFRCIYPNTTSFFEDFEGIIRAFKIDSVKVINNDTVYFPFHQIRPSDYKYSTQNCYIPDGASWLGNQIIHKTNGYYLFFNYLSDTIKINSLADFNEEWRCYIYKNNSYIKATVTSIYALTFLGLTDTVKTIRFAVFDNNNNPLSHPVNNLVILLSKNYGFVKSLNFLNFPDGLGYFIYDDISLVEFNLIGLSNPATGCHNITWQEVYNFDIGDELHTVYTSKEGDRDHYIRIDIFTIRTVIYKYTNYDTLIYKFARREQNLNQEINITIPDTIIWSNTTKKDTVTVKIAPNKRFDKLPGETTYYNFSDQYIREYYQKKFNNSRYSKFDPNNDRPLHLNDTCYKPTFVDGELLDNYIEGLGGPYYHGGFSGNYELKLVYYKKGTEIWGNPLVVGIEENQKNQSSIHIYPVPAKDVIHIDLSSMIQPPVFIQIINLQNKMMIAYQPVGTAIYEIPIRILPAGVYFVRVIFDQQPSIIRKMIVY